MKTTPAAISHAWVTVRLLVVGFCLCAGCGSGTESGQRALITSFRAVPGVIKPGEAVELRWTVTGGLLLRMEAMGAGVMPDERQPWVCLQDRGSLACVAPEMPEGAVGWSCEAINAGMGCRRALPVDTGAAVPVPLGTQVLPSGSLSTTPDATTVFKLIAEGTADSAAVAWVQVVVSRESTEGRIPLWTAWPSPALPGQDVVLTYRTVRCGAVKVLAVPEVSSDQLVPQEGNTDAAGEFVWRSADVTRDFLLSCTPQDGRLGVPVWARITVPVLQPVIPLPGDDREFPDAALAGDGGETDGATDAGQPATSDGGPSESAAFDDASL